MKKRRILLTCGKFISTLDLARKLHAAGHEVFVADTSKRHLCRFSNAVTKNYLIPSPRFETEASIGALVDIVKRENIDLLIPTYEETLYIAQYRDRFPCALFCSSFETLHNLHNKWLFIERQRLHGIPTPQTELVQHEDGLKDVTIDVPYALKACYSRSSSRVFCVKHPGEIPEINIEPHNPWIAQEWLHGEKLCTYSICRDGVVTAHLAYPVAFGRDNQYSLVYESVDRPDLLEWVQNLVAEENYTGQIGVDFIETPSGEIYAIECNPRSTISMELFTREQLIDALFGEPKEPHIAPLGKKIQVSFGMIGYGWRGRSFKTWAKTFFTTPDPIWTTKDLKCLLGIPSFFAASMIRAIKWRTSVIGAYSHDIDWDGEDFPQVALRVKNAS